MALLSDTDPDPTPRSTLCWYSTVGAYKHSDPEKKGKKEGVEMKDRTRRSGFIIMSLTWPLQPHLYFPRYSPTGTNKNMRNVQIVFPWA